HMVMSTLHTNSAPETLTRLRNMGVAAFNLATSVNLIVAQRLARRLCDCKEKLDIPKPALIEKGFSEADVDSGIEIFGPKGCDKCTAGYKGRVGIYEVVKITPKISKIIMEDGNALQIAEVAAAQGYNNINESALVKVKHGVTSLDEVDRVTSGH
ncbi:MAG TPA: ATPase, T2SS/T4P/T4SS family, partial [Pseudomonadales bacterium]|nr:ATPase, T2SS/T4P/T4SS family [Pseudomonadales bacterium]